MKSSSLLILFLKSQPSHLDSLSYYLPGVLLRIYLCIHCEAGCHYVALGGGTCCVDQAELELPHREVFLPLPPESGIEEGAVMSSYIRQVHLYVLVE